MIYSQFMKNTAANGEAKRDFRAEVTADIIELLENGTAPWVKPWVKPWKSNGSTRTPYNPTTGKAYRGGNVLALMVAAMRKGYSDPRWMTFNQAKDNGWSVRKGEKANYVEFWDVRTQPKKSVKESDDNATETRFVHRVYAVFNASQIEGVPALADSPRESWEVCEAGEKIMSTSGAEIRYGGDRAFYSRNTDSITLPTRDCFPTAEGFYGTAVHELVHWTGAASRLNRTFGSSFGDESYAREELRAEIGCMMVAAETGIPHEPGQHAAYIQSWVKVLREDKNEIFRAASDASRAADFLLGSAVSENSGEGGSDSNPLPSSGSPERTSMTNNTITMAVAA